MSIKAIIYYLAFISIFAGAVGLQYQSRCESNTRTVQESAPCRPSTDYIRYHLLGK